MAWWMEVSIDERMRRQEALCLRRRFETLHLPLSTPGLSAAAVTRVYPARETDLE